MFFGNLTMMTGAHFYLFIQCVFIAREQPIHPEVDIACPFFEIMSTIKACLDVIVWSAILLLCKHVSLLVLLLLLFHTKLSVDSLIFSVVAVSWCPSFSVRYLSQLC